MIYNNQQETCLQEVILQGGLKTLCSHPTEYVFSKKLRESGAASRRYPYCSVHRRLRRIHGPKSEHASRAVLPLCVKKEARKKRTRQKKVEVVS